MAIEFAPMPLPPTADPKMMESFGKEVKGVDLATLTPDSDAFKEIHDALYKHDALLFRNVRNLSSQQLYLLTKAFDPLAENFGHGNNKLGTQKAHMLRFLKTDPDVPQVQVIGNGTVHNHAGSAVLELAHPRHEPHHKTPLTAEDTAKGYTRFIRWHMDAALYDLSLSKASTLYALKVPKGPSQVVRYDDGSGDELPVPLATTALVSGRIMFDLLPPALKSVAVRSRVRYAPHPYIWIAPAKVDGNGLRVLTEGLEVPEDQLPPWDEEKVKVYPVLWKNPVTGALHFQVHPWCASTLFIDPLPEGASREGALYPDGARVTDLEELRELLYKMQRPAIDPKFVYVHDWTENDLVIFNNRGVLHTVVGTLAPDQVRLFHQCNLAASDEPVGPSAEDVRKWA